MSEALARLGSAPLLVYGARLAGRSIQDYLAARDVKLAAFLDRDASNLTPIQGVEVYTAEAWARNNDPKNARVILGLFNAFVDQSAIVKYLQSLGYSQILSLVDFVRLFPEEQPFRYWLTDPRIYETHAGHIARMRTALADEASQKLLDDIVAFRTGNGHWRLPPPSPRQYFPTDIPPWTEPLRMIDCGAYTGDTVQSFQAAGYRIEALATFEPDMNNYRELVKNLHEFEAVHFPCGVSDTNGVFRFDPVNATGGRLTDSGGELVFCVRLDDALPGFAPNLIKMDIEGAESAALRSAKEMLRRYRPGLAISIYHQADHLWSIFEYLKELDLGYRFYLRTHAHSTFETVLYALPSMNDS